MKFAIAAFLLFLSVPVFAQNIDCTNSDNHTQSDMNYCAGQDYQKADRALNIIWPKAMALMKSIDEYEPSASENLLKAQRAWIDYRDGHCFAEGAKYSGGSIRPLIVGTCLADLTRKRTEELTLLLREG